jgi:hypothetical protein
MKDREKRADMFSSLARNFLKIVFLNCASTGAIVKKKALE